MSVEVYLSHSCPFCWRVLDLLKGKGVSFKEIPVRLSDRNDTHFQQMQQRTGGCTTVPQVFVKDTHIGDCDQVHQLEYDGKLDAMLSI